MAGADGGADPGARPEWRWDVALSFAGAQRGYVEQVAEALKARGVRCFYDADEQIELWGKYLAEELPVIYGEQAATVVVFVSAEYGARDWTRHERRAALARAVSERREYVLPARFDDTPLPGLLSDMVAVDLRTRTPQQFAAMIAGKLAALAITAPAPPANARDHAQAVESAPPAGAVRAGEVDPRRLGVHAAISAPGASDDVPPEHVPRDVDAAEFGFRARAAATARQGGFTRASPSVVASRPVAHPPPPNVPLPASPSRLVRMLNVGGLVRHTAFSSDGRLLVTASIPAADSYGHPVVVVWDPATGQQLRRFLSSGPVAFSPDGSQLAIAIDTKEKAGTRSLCTTVQLRDSATDQLLTTVKGHPYGIGSLAFSPDGRLLATGGGRFDLTVRLWDPATGQELHCLDGHSAPGIRAMAFSPDGRLLATGGNDETARLWDPATGQHLHCLDGHTSSVRTIAFSPDGCLLATFGGDKTARLWNPATGQCLRTLDGASNDAWAGAFSPDGDLLATSVGAGGISSVLLWDPATGEHVRSLEDHPGVIWTGVFNPDGRVLAIGGRSSTVLLWDPATGQRLRTLKIASYSRTCNIWAVAFSPDGRLLATGGEDGTVRLWS